MHGALCTRVLLNLRKAAEDQAFTSPEFTMQATLVFDHSPLTELEASSGWVLDATTVKTATVRENVPS